MQDLQPVRDLHPSPIMFLIFDCACSFHCHRCYSRVYNYCVVHSRCVHFTRRQGQIPSRRASAQPHNTGSVWKITEHLSVLVPWACPRCFKISSTTRNCPDRQVRERLDAGKKCERMGFGALGGGRTQPSICSFCLHPHANGHSAIFQCGLASSIVPDIRSRI